MPFSRSFLLLCVDTSCERAHGRRIVVMMGTMAAFKLVSRTRIGGQPQCSNWLELHHRGQAVAPTRATCTPLFCRSDRALHVRTVFACPTVLRLLRQADFWHAVGPPSPVNHTTDRVRHYSTESDTEAYTITIIHDHLHGSEQLFPHRASRTGGEARQSPHFSTFLLCCTTDEIMYRVNSSIVPAACRLSQTRGYASFFEEKPLAVAWFTPVGVLGSGIMGGGIASTAAINGLNVTMVDIKQELLDKGRRAQWRGILGQVVVLAVLVPRVGVTPDIGGAVWSVTACFSNCVLFCSQP